MYKIKFLWECLWDDTSTTWWLYKMQHRIINREDREFKYKHWDELNWF